MMRMMRRLYALAALGRRHPFSVSLTTATAKTAAADVITQIFLEDNLQLDLSRTTVFTCFGFWYLGGFQYWLYVRSFGRWFPAAKAFGEHATLAARLKDRAGLKDLGRQVAVGNFIHIPLIFLPSFYLTQEIVHHGFDASGPVALGRYRQNCWSDLRSAWAIWIPGHVVFFSVPMWMRLPVNHLMSFAYVCVLSLMRGGESARITQQCD